MAVRKVAGRAGALTADDWLQAASRVIAEAGVSAVAVEPLARRLGVTKGSFYWHFPNRDALLEATLERWERESTEAVIAAVEQVADPRERLRRLAEVSIDDPLGSRTPGPGIAFDDAFELAVSDAVEDPIVQPVLRRVSERRVDYLQECYRALGSSPGEARRRALLVYAAYLGTLRLTREAPSRVPRGEEYRAYRQHFVETLVPGDGTGGSEKG